MELNGAVGIVAASVKVEFAGTIKSAWNLYRFSASKARAVGAVVILRPEIEVWAACRRKSRRHPGRTASNPSPTFALPPAGADEERDHLRVGIAGERLSAIERIGAGTRKRSAVFKNSRVLK